MVDHPFGVKSQWFLGKCSIKTYSINELLGTKLRALYQRRKGRDLYDLWLGLTRGNANPTQVVKVFKAYMSAEGHAVSLIEFRSNLAAKMKRKDFLGDTNSLLRPQVEYNPVEAYRIVDEQILSVLEL